MKIFIVLFSILTLDSRFRGNDNSALTAESRIKSVLKIGLAFGVKSVRSAYINHPLAERTIEKVHLSDEVHPEEK